MARLGNCYNQHSDAWLSLQAQLFSGCVGEENGFFLDVDDPLLDRNSACVYGVCVCVCVCVRACVSVCVCAACVRVFHDCLADQMINSGIYKLIRSESSNTLRKSL